MLAREILGLKQTARVRVMGEPVSDQPVPEGGPRVRSLQEAGVRYENSELSLEIQARWPFFHNVD